MILKLMTIYAIFVPIISLMWSNSLYFPITQLMYVIVAFNILFFLFSCIVIVKSIYLNNLKKNNLLFFLILILFFNFMGIAVGLLNGYNNKMFNDFYLLLIGPFLAYATYHSFVNLSTIEGYLENFSFYFTISLFVSVVIMQIESVLEIPHYPAIASNLAIIPLLYYYKQKKYLLTILVFILILLSGKRSIFIITLVLLPFLILLIKGIPPFKVFIIGIITFIITTSVSLTMITYLETNKNQFPMINNIINKFSIMNPFSSSYNIESAMGERFEEIFQSIESAKKNNMYFLIGSGNGFVYELDVQRKNLYEKEHHSVHFAPVDYFTKYGILFVFIITCIMIFYFYSTLKYFKNNIISLKIFWSYQLFVCINSLIGANFGLDYFFWISIALSLKMINKIKKENRCVA